MKCPFDPRLVALAVLIAPLPAARGALLTFDILPVPANNSPLPQDYGDAVTAATMPSADGQSEYLYQEVNGWTPGVTVGYGSERPGESPVIFNGAEWAGVCRLWSPSFRTGQPIGDNAAGAMPVGFEYQITFTPVPDSNRGVIVNSFVLDDKAGYFDSVPHQVQWRVALGTAAGQILASGSATVANGENLVVQTGLTGTEPFNEPVVLVLKRLAGIEDDLAVDDIDFDETGFPTVAYNTGNLGTTADGLNAAGVLINRPGALRAGDDRATSYGSSQNTTIPFLEPVNPPSDQPFTIEFWARPTGTDNDDAPVFNRVSDGDRSGWVFFQRNEATGWNLRMYDGVGSNVGWDLTGGPYTLNTWSHVVAVWNGTAPRLYVNGQLVDTTNAADRSGNYNASTSAIFSVGSYDNGGSPFNGLVDEIAFYPTALTGARILAHFQAAASTTPGAYSSQVAADGALIYLQQNPPTIDLTFPDGNPTVTFTGKLDQSESLATWSNLQVTSPYTVPALNRPKSLFFRVRR
jgi:hypothetical protein